MSFKDFGLSNEVVRGTQAMGFSEPTPIQLRAFPIVLSGKDLIGTAQTGTGKTAAFALPILSRLEEEKEGFRSMTGIERMEGDADVAVSREERYCCASRAAARVWSSGRLGDVDATAAMVSGD